MRRQLLPARLLLLCPGPFGRLLRPDGRDPFRLGNLECALGPRRIIEVGHRNAGESLAHRALDRPEFSLFRRWHEGEGLAGCFGARGAPHPVDV